MGTVALDELTPERLLWFAEVYERVQRGARVLSLGPKFPDDLLLSEPWWWLRYFRVAPLVRHDGEEGWHTIGSRFGSWEPTAEGIRLATRLRLQGKL